MKNKERDLNMELVDEMLKAQDSHCQITDCANCEFYSFSKNRSCTVTFIMAYLEKEYEPLSSNIEKQKENEE